MRILFAASEVFPLIKTGGLADVAGALPDALTKAGEDVRILMPAYSQALAKMSEVEVVAQLGDPLHVGSSSALLKGKLPGTDICVYLIQNQALYERDGGPYADASGADWPDNALRFGMLSWVAAHLCTDGTPLDWQPDLLHCHDWQTGLAPAYLHAWQVEKRTIFTIHNIAYQGQFDAQMVQRLGLPWSMFKVDGLEYWGTMSFLKAGLHYSDAITTVSPRYSREIQSSPHGCGMEGLLAFRAKELTGILNGADYSVWDPKADPEIVQNYDLDTLAAGKAANKAALQAELGLAQKPDAPLFVIVSRLNDLKGTDLVLAVLPNLLAKGGQLAVLGSGDKRFEDAFRKVAASNPDSVAIHIGYSESMAHRLMAGGDVLLMPSRFEPCGLTQFYAFRYGTLPLVHATGGLADTVVDTTYDSLMTGSATGFVFDHANVAAMQWSLERAIGLYARPESWHKVRDSAVCKDFSWGKSAQRYQSLYQEVLASAPFGLAHT